MTRKLLVSILLLSVLVFDNTGIMIRSLGWAVLADLGSSSCAGGDDCAAFRREKSVLSGGHSGGKAAAVAMKGTP